MTGKATIQRIIILLLLAVFVTIVMPHMSQAYTKTKVEFDFFDGSQQVGTGEINFGAIDFGTQYALGTCSGNVSCPDVQLPGITSMQAAIRFDVYTWYNGVKNQYLGADSVIFNLTPFADTTIMINNAYPVFPVILTNNNPPPYVSPLLYGSFSSFGRNAYIYIYQDGTFNAHWDDGGSGGHVANYTTQLGDPTWTTTTWFDDPDTGAPSGVPEPSTILLLGLSLIGLAGVSRKLTN